MGTHLPRRNVPFLGCLEANIKSAGLQKLQIKNGINLIDRVLAEVFEESGSNNKVDYQAGKIFDSGDKGAGCNGRINIGFV